MALFEHVKLDYVARSSVKFSIYTWSEVNHNVSAYELPRNYSPLHSVNCFDHLVYAPQISTYQNIAKVLIYPGNYNYQPHKMYIFDPISYEEEILCSLILSSNCLIFLARKK